MICVFETPDDIADRGADQKPLAWISTEPDLPNMCVAKGFTRLTNFGRAIRPIGAYKGSSQCYFANKNAEIPRNVKT